MMTHSEQIRFTANDETLVGTIYDNAQHDKPTLLCLHGSR